MHSDAKGKQLNYLVVSTPSNNSSQIGSFPQVGMNMKTIKNHQPVNDWPWKKQSQIEKDLFKKKQLESASNGEHPGKKHTHI